MNNSIYAEVIKSSFWQSPDNRLRALYSIIVTNKGGQPAQIKIPLTRYVNIHNEVEVQKNWGKKANGNKGMSLLEGTFCQMDLVYNHLDDSQKKGDRLLVTVELGKQFGRIDFVFECTGVTNFVLIATTFDAPPEPASTIKSASSMTGALKRIALLEEGLSEVLDNFDAMKRDFAKLQAMSRSGSTQTLAEVFAWLAIQGQVSTADLRARLLPLNVLTGALVNEINELAIDITGEVALEEVGNEIVVTRTTLGQILGSLDVKQFERRVSS